MKIKEPNIKLTNEDNMALMKRYPNNYFDLAIVDPPYGLKCFKKGFSSGRFKAFSKSNLSFNNNIPNSEYFAELFRVSKNQIVFGANNFMMPPTEYFLIWNKKQTVDNFASAEYAWVSPGLKKPSKIFDYSIHKHNATAIKIHPTQKPKKLYEWILKNYANPGDKILDTHLGSGSIALACYNYKFDLVACEIDKDYFKAAVKRFEEYKSQLILF